MSPHKFKEGDLVCVLKDESINIMETTLGRVIEPSVNFRYATNTSIIFTDAVHFYSFKFKQKWWYSSKEKVIPASPLLKAMYE